MPRLLAAETKDEIVRLRVEERLSAPEIARRLNIKAGNVYQLLKPFPLTREERSAIKSKQIRAIHEKRGTVWTKDDDAKLTKLFRFAPRERVLAALPHKKWGAIAKRAADMGLRRDRTAATKRKRQADSLCWSLREARLLSGVEQQELADKIGIHKLMLLRWETGQSRPSLFNLRAWMDALDCDVQVIAKHTGEPPRKRGRQSWTQETDEILQELAIQGASLAEMARAVRRKPHDVEKRCKDLGIHESEVMRNVSGMTRARLG